MRELKVQARARRDLKQIWHDTAERWNEKQANKYLRELNAKMTELTRNPKLGRPREDIDPALRSLHVNHHVAFYTITSSTVRIVRVLHERMDVEEHL